jgi:hypothetical protein
MRKLQRHSALMSTRGAVRQNLQVPFTKLAGVHLRRVPDCEAWLRGVS